MPTRFTPQLLCAARLPPVLHSLAGGRKGKLRPVALIPEMFTSFSGQRGRVSRPLGLQLILSPAVAAGAGLGEFGCSPTRLSCPGPGFVRSHEASLLAPSQSPEPPGGHRLPPMEWPEAASFSSFQRLLARPVSDGSPVPPRLQAGPSCFCRMRSSFPLEPGPRPAPAGRCSGTAAQDAPSSCRLRAAS